MERSASTEESDLRAISRFNPIERQASATLRCSGCLFCFRRRYAHETRSPNAAKVFWSGFQLRRTHCEQKSSGLPPIVFSNSGFRCQAVRDNPCRAHCSLPGRGLAWRASIQITDRPSRLEQRPTRVKQRSRAANGSMAVLFSTSEGKTWRHPSSISKISSENGCGCHTSTTL